MEDFQKNTNVELAREYIMSGTFHSAVFVFDVSSEDSFRQMEDWFDFFRKQSLKTSQCISYAIVGTKADKLSDPV